MEGDAPGDRIALMAKKKGKPAEWSQKLWQAYTVRGESDKKYVESFNRFLKAMLDLHPAPISELILEPGRVFIEGQGTEDELDVYRDWYAKHIKWPEECLCEIEDSFVDPAGEPVMDFDPDTGEWVPFTRVHPWFLGASRQLGRHLAKGQVPEPRQGLLSEPKNYDTSEKIVKYLTESGWAVDQGGLEKAPDCWLGGDTRRPDESLKNFINRVLRWTDIYLTTQIAEKALTRLGEKVELQGKPLDPANKHEEMLVRRMFGQPIPEIIDACRDALLDKKGRPLSDPRKTVYDRTNLIAEHLGFLPVSGEEK